MEGAQRGTVNDGTSVGGGYEAGTEVVVNRRDHGKGLEGLGLTEGGKGGGGSRGHRVVGGRDDGLELKGGVGRGWEVAIVLKCGDLRSGAPRTILCLVKGLVDAN